MSSECSVNRSSQENVRYRSISLCPPLAWGTCFSSHISSSKWGLDLSDKWFRVTQLRSGLELEPRPRFRLGTPKEADPLSVGRVVTQTGHWNVGFWLPWNQTAVQSIAFHQPCLQLSISVLMLSWHDLYVDCAMLAAYSPPALKFAIQ
jgi:hypothetical protein